MNYNFNEDDVAQQVLELMRSNNINPAEHIFFVFDNKKHRFQTEEEEKGKKAGEYRLSLEGWPAGYIKDYRQNLYVSFHFDRERLDNDGKKWFSTEEKYRQALEQAKKSKAERDKDEEEERLKAIEAVKKLYQQLPNAKYPNMSNQFPYLIKKKIKLPFADMDNYNIIKYDESRNSIYIPLRNIEGEIKSCQWINAQGGKIFYPNTPIKGNFYDVGLSRLKTDKKKELPILIGEGIATMLTIYELTERKYPVIAAMNCGNLEDVVKAIQSKYSGWKILIMADNDFLRKDNPGLTHALKVRDNLKSNGVIYVIYPKFSRREAGTDWNDYCAIHGEIVTKEVILKEINVEQFFQGDGSRHIRSFQVADMGPAQVNGFCQTLLGYAFQFSVVSNGKPQLLVLVQSLLSQR